MEVEFCVNLGQSLDIFLGTKFNCDGASANKGYSDAVLWQIEREKHCGQRSRGIITPHFLKRSQTKVYPHIVLHDGWKMSHIMKNATYHEKCHIILWKMSQIHWHEEKCTASEIFCLPSHLPPNESNSTSTVLYFGINFGESVNVLLHVGSCLGFQEKKT